MKIKAVWVLSIALIPTLGIAEELTKLYAGDPIIAEELNDNFELLEARISELEEKLSNGGLPGEPFRYGLDVDLAPGYDYYITDINFPGGFESRFCFDWVSQISISGTKDGAIFSDRTASENVYTGGCNVSGKKIDFVTPLKVSGGQTLEKYLDLPLSIFGYRIPR